MSSKKPFKSPSKGGYSPSKANRKKQQVSLPLQGSGTHLPKQASIVDTKNDLFQISRDSADLNVVGKQFTSSRHQFDDVNNTQSFFQNPMNPLPLNLSQEESQTPLSEFGSNQFGVTVKNKNNVVDYKDGYCNTSSVKESRTKRSKDQHQKSLLNNSANEHDSFQITGKKITEGFDSESPQNTTINQTLLITSQHNLAPISSNLHNPASQNMQNSGQDQSSSKEDETKATNILPSPAAVSSQLLQGAQQKLSRVDYEKLYPQFNYYQMSHPTSSRKRSRRRKRGPVQQEGVIGSSLAAGARKGVVGSDAGLVPHASEGLQNQAAEVLIPGVLGSDGTDFADGFVVNQDLVAEAKDPIVGHPQVQSLNFQTGQAAKESLVRSTPDFDQAWKQKMKGLSVYELKQLIDLQERQNQYDKVQQRKRFQRGFMTTKSQGAGINLPKGATFERSRQAKAEKQSSYEDSSQLFEQFVQRIKVDQQVPTIVTHDILRKADSISVKPKSSSYMPLHHQQQSVKQVKNQLVFQMPIDSRRSMQPAGGLVHPHQNSAMNSKFQQHSSISPMMGDQSKLRLGSSDQVHLLDLIKRPLKQGFNEDIVASFEQALELTEREQQLALQMGSSSKNDYILEKKRVGAIKFQEERERFKKREKSISRLRHQKRRVLQSLVEDMVGDGQDARVSEKSKSKGSDDISNYDAAFDVAFSSTRNVNRDSLHEELQRLSSKSKNLLKITTSQDKAMLLQAQARPLYAQRASQRKLTDKMARSEYGSAVEHLKVKEITSSIGSQRAVESQPTDFESRKESTNMARVMLQSHGGDIFKKQVRNSMNFTNHFFSSKNQGAAEHQSHKLLPIFHNEKPTNPRYSITQAGVRQSYHFGKKMSPEKTSISSVMNRNSMNQVSDQATFLNNQKRLASKHTPGNISQEFSIKEGQQQLPLGIHAKTKSWGGGASAIGNRRFPLGKMGPSPPRSNIVSAVTQTREGRAALGSGGSRPYGTAAGTAVSSTAGSVIGSADRDTKPYMSNRSSKQSLFFRKKTPLKIEAQLREKQKKYKIEKCNFTEIQKFIQKGPYKSYKAMLKDLVKTTRRKLDEDEMETPTPKQESQWRLNTQGTINERESLIQGPATFRGGESLENMSAGLNSASQGVVRLSKHIGMFQSQFTTQKEQESNADLDALNYSFQNAAQSITEKQINSKIKIVLVNEGIVEHSQEGHSRDHSSMMTNNRDSKTAPSRTIRDKSKQKPVKPTLKVVAQLSPTQGERTGEPSTAGVVQQNQASKPGALSVGEPSLALKGIMMGNSKTISSNSNRGSSSVKFERDIRTQATQPDMKCFKLDRTPQPENIALTHLRGGSIPASNQAAGRSLNESIINKDIDPMKASSHQTCGKMSEIIIDNLFREMQETELAQTERWYDIQNFLKLQGSKDRIKNYTKKPLIGLEKIQQQASKEVEIQMKKKMAKMKRNLREIDTYLSQKNLSTPFSERMMGLPAASGEEGTVGGADQSQVFDQQQQHTLLQMSNLKTRSNQAPLEGQNTGQVQDSKIGGEAIGATPSMTLQSTEQQVAQPISHQDQAGKEYGSQHSATKDYLVESTPQPTRQKKLVNKVSFTDRQNNKAAVGGLEDSKLISVEDLSKIKVENMDASSQQVHLLMNQAVGGGGNHSISFMGSIVGGGSSKGPEGSLGVPGSASGGQDGGSRIVRNKLLGSPRIMDRILDSHQEMISKQQQSSIIFNKSLKLPEGVS